MAKVPFYGASGNTLMYQFCSIRNPLIGAVVAHHRGIVWVVSRCYVSTYDLPCHRSRRLATMVGVYQTAAPSQHGAGMVPCRGKHRLRRALVSGARHHVLLRYIVHKLPYRYIVHTGILSARLPCHAMLPCRTDASFTLVH